jgi:signal transduction histidine kinase
MEIHLLLHNIISVASVIVALGAALFTYLNGRRQPANITFSLVFFGAAFFAASHVIGVNIHDPYISKTALMFNVCLFLLSAVTLHAVLAVTGQDKEKRTLINFTYGAATALTFFFIIFPNLFLYPSVPKMYFPSYYNPGELNLLRIIFMYAYTTPFSIWIMYRATKAATSPMQKNRFKYLMWCLLFGYGVGFIPNLLVYNIPVDPLFGMGFAVIFSIPFVYGALKYEILNIRVIATQAFLYSVAVGIVGSIIVSIFYLIEKLKGTFPDFPIWATPLVSALLIVTVSVLVWQKMRENDLLKYEFVNTVTHKFRTPMTRIKWVVEDLLGSNLSAEQKTMLTQIESDNEKMVELTRTLLKVSPTENSFSEYRIERFNLSKAVAETVQNIKAQAELKKIRIVEKIEPEVYCECDPSRLKFVIQVITENAINYTPANGVVTISLEEDGESATLDVEDNGIGIARDELPLIFSKFYRGKEAQSVDTEGLGIGLHVAKGIIENHHGKISIHSGGSGLGSKFSVILPNRQ